jgi:hypothetical protein
MTSLAAINSSDPALEADFRQWIADSRMVLPEGLKLSIDVVDILPAVEDPRTAYRQGLAEIRAGEPLGWVLVSWPGYAAARIDEQRPIARVLLTRDAAGDRERLFRGFLIIVLIFLWKRDGRYHVHAGIARDPEGRNWMLVGNSGSGKSTTMALLATRHWKIGTDDIAFLVNGGSAVIAHAFRDRIALRPGGLDLLGRAGGIELPRRNKTGFWPEELGAEWVPAVEPDIVLFTQGLGPQTRLEPAEPREILNSLIHGSLWVMFEATGATEHLELLSRIGRQARCYRAQLGPDLFNHPDALAGFLP